MTVSEAAAADITQDHRSRCALALSVLRHRFDAFDPDVILLENVLTGVAFPSLVMQQLIGQQ